MTDIYPSFGRRDPDPRGYYGAYGGRFVPETLVAPVQELERAYFEARDTDTFYPEVLIGFVVAEEGRHYHVPLLLSPFAYSTYRGS